MLKEVYDLTDLRDWRKATDGVRPPFRLAVLGDPVAHSASPPMQNAALKVSGLDMRYTRLHIRPEELAEALRLLPTQGFIGANITIPHKAAALAAMDRVDEHAQRIGVVNTVMVEGGKLAGYNTDGPGLVRAVHEVLGAELKGLRVMILGAGGGAGRAIALQCGIEKCPRVVLVNRTPERAHNLLAELQAGSTKASLIPWEDAELRRELAETDLVINCSSVGMKSTDPSPLAPALLRPGLLVFDTIYTAARTHLMQAADAAGARSANGLAMLLHQGALAYAIWFGREAPLEVMRAALAGK